MKTTIELIQDMITTAGYIFLHGDYAEAKIILNAMKELSVKYELKPSDIPDECYTLEQLMEDVMAN